MLVSPLRAKHTCNVLAVLFRLLATMQVGLLLLFALLVVRVHNVAAFIWDCCDK